MKAVQLCLVLLCLTALSHGFRLRGKQFPPAVAVPGAVPVAPQVVAPQMVAPQVVGAPQVVAAPQVVGAAPQVVAPSAPGAPPPPGPAQTEGKMMQAVCNSADLALRFIYNMAQQARQNPTVQMPALAATISATTATVCQTFFQGATTSPPVAQMSVVDYDSFFNFLCSTYKADPSRIRHAAGTLISTQTIFKPLVSSVFQNSENPDPRLPQGVCAVKVPKPGVPVAPQAVVAPVAPQAVVPGMVVPQAPQAVVPGMVLPQAPQAVVPGMVAPVAPQAVVPGVVPTAPQVAPVPGMPMAPIMQAPMRV